MRTGARILVDQLLLHGVDTAFCVPGESYIAVLDALYVAPIRLVSCRHDRRRLGIEPCFSSFFKNATVRIQASLVADSR